ncbi:hypothetical protein BDV96DRAFT_207551 [Lophiotrema nucula]|uniref:Uncharacterized protein n=1 Tax=Lophiotrema nucula TaxID=690887 RepID=A0A6A5ZSQ0_9PLEO|nr:hypothetical protein BDV96DRAFT_207551 [Lophiotrema nucula]
MALYDPSAPLSLYTIYLPSPPGRSRSRSPDFRKPYISAPSQRDPWYPRPWPHGVIHGGTLLDMTDTLRNNPSGTGTDQAFSLWLEGTYLIPFQTVQRLHGLIVRDEEDMETLVQAYKRYTRFLELPAAAPPAQLFIPGLEPLEAPKGDQTEIPRIPEVVYTDGAKGAGQYKSGLYGGGKLVAFLRDGRKWEREIWEHPMPKIGAQNIKTEDEEQDEETPMEMDLSKPCQAPGCCERHDEQDIADNSSNGFVGVEIGDDEEEEADIVSRPGLTSNMRDVLLALKMKLERELDEELVDEGPVTPRSDD